jgi:hypothetical protein
MTTEKQREANRRNAKKSTGPKTTEGLLKSSMNAAKHRLTALQMTLDDESPGTFQIFHKGLVEAFQPVGGLEDQLVERMAVCDWRLRRVYRTESRLHASERLAVEADFIRSEKELADRHEETLSRPPALNEKETRQMRRIIRDRRRSAGTRMLINEQREVAALGDVGSVFRRLAKEDPLGLLLRYEASIERSYYRALHNLERVQARRKGEMVAAPLAVDIAGEN